MKNPILIPELRELLKKKNFQILKSFIDDQHSKEVAEYLGLLEPQEIWEILDIVDIQKRSEIFCYLDMDVQVTMVSGQLKYKITELLKQISNDDRADLFLHLEKNVADRLMLLLPLNDRTDILKLTSYKEKTAGAIMTTDYANLYENDSIENAIEKIRSMAPSKETIYYIYVTNDEGKLIGFVSLRKMILSGPNQQIKDIMKKDVIYAYVNDEQEKAANLIEKYDLIALPVVDYNEKLAGIITYDDAIDVIRDEETEDLEKLMAISGGVEERSYLDIPVFTHFKKRISWVIILGVIGLLSSVIMKGFQGTLEKIIILTFYIPLLNSAGGNTGSQSATVVLRAIALKELFPRDISKVIKKEFLISTLICICFGLLTYLGVMLFSAGQDIPKEFTLTSIALLVSLALSIQVVWSTLFGAIIPIIATKLRLDPAVISNPALTTIVDMGGITMYFTLANQVLGI
ncbi:MAG: magnesium transporter [Spirochaetota bacterium]|nr:magnesium transporter [Spirochaetota bacterium]